MRILVSRSSQSALFRAHLQVVGSCASWYKSKATLRSSTLFALLKSPPNCQTSGGRLIRKRTPDRLEESAHADRRPPLHCNFSFAGSFASVSGQRFYKNAKPALSPRGGTGSSPKMPSPTSNSLQGDIAVVNSTVVDGTQSTHLSSPPEPVLSLDLIGDHTTEILSVDSSEPPLAHLVIIPGNPGIVAYYEEFISLISEAVDRKWKITCISHVGHTQKDWEKGKLSSLQDQIEHKAAYLRTLEDHGLPVILVGHSIGAHIALELLRRFPNLVTKVIGLYPFLSLNLDSSEQKLLGRAARFYPARLAFSALASTLGFLPSSLQKALLQSTIGKAWDQPAIDITRRYMLTHHVAANYVYMGATEFETFARLKLPDWEFLENQKEKVALLFGADDHWGPTSLSELARERVPMLHVIQEKEGLLHAFCCTHGGSLWVAKVTQSICSALERAAGSSET